ncbi:MAG: O-antigen ligase family protein [Agathobacter sp.]
MFILAPFMYPRGFAEHFSWYKMFFTLWTYGAALLIILFFLFKIVHGYQNNREKLIILLAYFGYFAVITLLIQGGISEGIQKIFIAPIFCLFCLICLQSYTKDFLYALSTLLVLAFGLNITIFFPGVLGDYFNVDRHLLFLGHVQIFAQLGVLGLLLSTLLKAYGSKMFSGILFALSIINMLLSDTVASKIVIIFYAFMWILSFIPQIKKIAYVDSRWIVFCGLGLNVLLFAFKVLLNGKYAVNGLDLSLNGRMFVWDSVLDMVKKSVLFGYGAYGVSFKVFWSAGEGMNYAHNEVLQKLIDGGICFLILFVVFLFIMTWKTHKTKNKNIKKEANKALLVIFLIMLIESVTEYYYVYIIWLIVAYLPEIEQSIIGKEEAGYGIDYKN